MDHYFYFSGQMSLSIKSFFPISKICQFLAALSHEDDTDLYVFKSGFDDTQGMVVKAQCLLNSWNELLKFTGGNLKLAK